MKSRKELIEELEQINYNIITVERCLSQVLEQNSYFLIFGTRSQFEHKQEIQTKCLAYWRRKFNRVLVKLEYKI